jgi:hypothetical protein
VRRMCGRTGKAGGKGPGIFRAHGRRGLPGSKPYREQAGDASCRRRRGIIWDIANGGRELSLKGGSAGSYGDRHCVRTEAWWL